jgi:hypothetical protein
MRTATALQAARPLPGSGGDVHTRQEARRTGNGYLKVVPLLYPGRDGAATSQPALAKAYNTGMESPGWMAL